MLAFPRKFLNSFVILYKKPTGILIEIALNKQVYLRKNDILKMLTYVVHAEKAMAPHSSTLAWKIPWTEEPDMLQSMGSKRVGHD